MPAVCAVFAPKAGLPEEGFFLDCAQHQQNQTCSGKLGKNAENYAQSACEFSSTQKSGKALAHANALAAAFRIAEMAPAAGSKDSAYHQAQQQKSKISELGELRKQDVNSLKSVEPKRITST